MEKLSKMELETERLVLIMHLKTDQTAKETREIGTRVVMKRIEDMKTPI